MTDSVNDINRIAYSNIKEATVHASKDTNKDEKVSLQEAGGNSIFEQTETNMSTALDKAVNDSTRLSQELKDNANTKSIVQKYLGNTAFSTLMNKFSSFSDIAYKAVQIKDDDNKTDVQKEIDSAINTEIDKQVQIVNETVTSEYTKALENALKQAENELVGDKDLKNEDGSVSTKDNNYSKLKDLVYQRPADNNSGEHTEVSTFNSSAKGAESQSQGYQNTVAYLEANGAKAKTKLVNGQEQTVYKIKDDQGTRYVTVDDAGQVHNLDKNKGFLRSSKFTTQDSIEVAIEDTKAQTGLDNLNDVKVKVRNVDGQKQSVMTWRDNDGNKHSRVIDHDNTTGLSSSLEVHKVNAGGRAKYSSDVSGLGALASKDPNDDIQFNDDKQRFQNGTWTDEKGETHADNVTTQHGRMKLDKANTDLAIQNITTSAKSVGATSTENGNITTITFPNGHSYQIDKTDNVSANRTMRLVQGEINRTQQIHVNDKTETVNVDTSNIVEDGRADTNLAGSHTGEKWRVGSGDVEGVGVDSPQNHTPHTKGQGKVNSVRYGANISRAQFAQEGWKASAGRTAEGDILATMDSTEIKGDGKSVRNLKTATEFAERFIKAMQDKHSELGGKEYNTEMLANAIKDANPSFFDNNGNMYKNADFSRLNLPKKLDRYEKS